MDVLCRPLVLKSQKELESSEVQCPAGQKPPSVKPTVEVHGEPSFPPRALGLTMYIVILFCSRLLLLLLHSSSSSSIDRSIDPLLL